jgi:hypothetical protein
VGLLLLGALAWWFDLWPGRWTRGLLGAERVRTLSQLLTGKRPPGSAPARPAEVASAGAPPVPVSPAGGPTTEGPAHPAPASTAEAKPMAPAPSPPPAPSTDAPAEARPSTAGVPAASAAAARRPRAEPAGPAHRFSLQVASCPDPASSLAHAEVLRKQGLEAFTVPARVRGKGVWYRVLVGGFASAAAAVEAGQALRAQGQVGDSLVLSLPFAVEVPGLAGADQAASALALARSHGYLPTLRPDGRNPSAGPVKRLRVEAFPSPTEANRLVELLRAEGLSPRVIRR